MSGVAHLLWTIAVTAALCIPLGISLWALLDAARRPAWAWALADRNQAMWIAMVLFGFLTVIGGLLISGTYLLRVRPRVADAENGRFDPESRRRHRGGDRRESGPGSDEPGR